MPTPFLISSINILFIFALVALSCQEARARSFEDTYEATVIQVYDGDTFTAVYHDEEIRIRLYGIDAPENNQPWGKESKAFLEGMLLSETVVVRTLYLDRYGHEMAIIALPTGEVIQELLLQEGHAMVYPQYCDNPRCTEWRELERKARKDRIGLWNSDGVIAPWEWIRTRFYAH